MLGKARVLFGAGPPVMVVASLWAYESFATRSPASGQDEHHDLYLLYPPKRGLYVFEVDEEPLRPFGMVTIEEDGNAKPMGSGKFGAMHSIV